jgi:small subunit ribosomal protein S1
MVDKNNGNINPETPQMDSPEENLVAEEVVEKIEDTKETEATPAVEETKTKTEDKTEEQTEEPTEEKAEPMTEEDKSEEPVISEDEKKSPAKQKTAEKIDEIPSGEEQIVNIKDLKHESEYSEEEFKFLSDMYDKTLNEIKQGDIVKGKVLDVTDNEVIVDIGFKSEGIVPIEEFETSDKVNIGDEVEVYLESLEDMNGQLILSRRRADFIRVWENVVEKHEKDETITGMIVRRIKGGMVVSLNGVDAFLPGSQIDVKPIRDFDSYLGKEKEFKIVKVNHARRNIVVSSRVLIEKEMESQRSEIIDTIEKGQVRNGTVKNITDFGVFIDLGGIDGLLHITDLSWGRVNHPSEVVKLDEEIEVVILDYNENKDRISLGRKQLLPHPWENIGTKYPVDQVVEGKVVSLTDYGAFIELETGIEGLIHISEMSWSQHIKHPSQLLHVGQEVSAKVLSIESEEKKISLGLKQLEPDPWENIDEKYPLNSKHNGVVRNLTQFGAFVELEEGIDGLVHISDLSWTKKIRHPSEVVKKGDEIEVIVLGINRDERRIALGHKQIDENPWDVFEDTYKVDTETEGKVARIIDKGVIVTLPMGVDGFIPMTHLGHPKLKKATEYYNIGDDIPAKVIEFDKENKKIVLSVTNYFKGKEDKELATYLSGHGVEKTTLQDIVKDLPEDLSTEEKPAAEKKTSAKKKEETDKEVAAPEPEAESAEEVKTETDDTKKADKSEVEKAEQKSEDKKDVAPEPAIVEEKAEEPAPVEDKAKAKDDVSEEEVKAADKKEKPVKEKKPKAKKETKPATEKKTKTTAKKTTTKKKEAAADTKKEKSE